MKRIPESPSIGVCVSSFAAFSYVHLQLEAYRRFAPDVPLIVFDDSSHQEAALRDLCASYSAEFVRSEYRHVAAIGDLYGFVTALEFGLRRELDLVVKVSRRFVIAKPWVYGLQELAANTQSATYTGADAYHDFGFRSECVAMHVDSWVQSGALREMKGYCERNEVFYVGVPESYHHDLAKEVQQWAHPLIGTPTAAQSWTDPRGYPNSKEFDPLARHETLFKRGDNYAGYVSWPLLGLHRKQRIAGILQHDVSQPYDYAEMARDWDLPYRTADFLDPNDKAGDLQP